MQQSNNIAQEKAISHGTGPMLVLAGPGSGKTFTIAHRIKYLIEEKQVDPSEILVITFSKAASINMKKRFTDLCNDQFYPVNFGTFHAIFYYILRNTFHYQVGNIITEAEKREYITTILANSPYQKQEFYDTAEHLLAEISFIKNSGQNSQSFQSNYLDPEAFRELFREYEEHLENENKIDFEDMVLKCRDLFLSRSDILKTWQNRFRFLLIDEFQDINPLQYSVIRMLAEPERNLFVVGDDDQSIYGFRGSDPNIMLGFSTDYPESQKVLLDRNYRSTKTITDAAAKVIEANKIRYKKVIVSNQIEKGEVRISNFQTKEMEYQYLIDQIRKTELVERMGIAVIYRTNYDASYLAEKLIQEKIPFNFRERPQNIYQHFVAKDLLQYLLFSEKQTSRADFFRIMNKPKRYIARNSVAEETFSFASLCQFYKEKEYMITIIKKMEYDLLRVRQMDPFAAVNYIRKGIGYDDYLRQIAFEKKLDYQELLDIADQFQQRTKEFSKTTQLVEHIRSYEKELSNFAKKKEEQGPTLLTMHGSKGLEFNSVFLPDCNEGIVPHKKSLSSAEIEEERRMFYVAMTRAKERLEILFVDGTKEEPVMPSRFIKQFTR